MRQIRLRQQPAVLRKSALSRIEKARARTLKMTIVIGEEGPRGSQGAMAPLKKFVPLFGS